MNKICINKYLVNLVILLFIGVALAPTINASVVKDEFVELEIEFCGLGKKHTVKLTQQEAYEVNHLFDDIKQHLSEVETREEAEEIFKDTIVELDKYGLLGGLSIRQAQRLITRNYYNYKNLNLNSVNTEYTNICCFLYGNVNALNLRHILRIRINRFYVIYDILDLILFNGYFRDYILAYFGWRAFIAYQRAYGEPFQLFSNIMFYKAGNEDYLITKGLLGNKEWEGHFTGNIPIPLRCKSLYGDSPEYPAIIGFSGISFQWYNHYPWMPTFEPLIIGRAPLVSVELI